LKTWLAIHNLDKPNPNGKLGTRMLADIFLIRKHPRKSASKSPCVSVRVKSGDKGQVGHGIFCGVVSIRAPIRANGPIE